LWRESPQRRALPFTVTLSQLRAFPMLALVKIALVKSRFPPIVAPSKITGPLALNPFLRTISPSTWRAFASTLAAWVPVMSNAPMQALRNLTSLARKQFLRTSGKGTRMELRSSLPSIVALSSPIPCLVTSRTAFLLVHTHIINMALKT
jgi:hypothetical protein